MRITFYILVMAAGFLLLPQASAAGGPSAAPAECLDTARKLLAYLLDEKTDIGSDRAAQGRWLGSRLQSELGKKRQACKEEMKRRPTDRIEPPSSRDFLLAWEPPSAHAIVGSRRYGDTAFVDVEFRWTAGRNYAGNRRLQSYIFVLENGAWKLDDVYSAREPYAAPGNLSSQLRSRP